MKAHSFRFNVSISLLNRGHIVYFNSLTDNIYVAIGNIYKQNKEKINREKERGKNIEALNWSQETHKHNIIEIENVYRHFVLLLCRCSTVFNF